MSAAPRSGHGRCATAGAPGQSRLARPRRRAQHQDYHGAGFESRRASAGGISQHMIVLFLILTIINLICLLGTAVLGYGNSVADDWGGYHQLAGALATICACAVHCV